MRDYSYKELGMLLGAALGGGIAILCFSFTGSALFFMIAGVGMAIGILGGNLIDKRRVRKEE